jgi:prepilin-type N-terminal cleavage/methylation domain-containing protein
MRRGTSLLELIVVLAIIGLLAGVVAPGAAQLRDRLAVEHEAGRILSAYRAAWLTARTQHRLVVLRITPDSLAIRTVRSAGAPDTTLSWLGPGPTAGGVDLPSGAHSTVFGPDGVAMGLSNTSHRLRKGSAGRQVVVSRLGRVRIAP